MAKKRNKSRGKRAPLTPEQTRERKITSETKKLFPGGTSEGATAGRNIYNQIFDQNFQNQQKYDYQVPAVWDNFPGSEGETLNRYRDLSIQGLARDPESQAALDLFKQSATRQEFLSPELLDAYSQAKALALGEATPAANAQRELLNQTVNSGLQTGLRGARGLAAQAGIRGGAEGSLARPALRDYGQALSQGQAQLQLGNLKSYQDLASDMNAQREAARSGALGAYNTALGQRQSFEELRNQARMNAYSDLQQGLYNRYFDLQERNRQRGDAYRSGELGALYGGGAIRTNQKAQDRAFELQQMAIEAGVPPAGFAFGGAPEEEFGDNGATGASQGGGVQVQNAPSQTGGVQGKSGYNYGMADIYRWF